MTRNAKERKNRPSAEQSEKTTYVIGCPSNGCGELTVIAPGHAECPMCGESVIEAGFTE